MADHRAKYLGHDELVSKYNWLIEALEIIEKHIGDGFASDVASKALNHVNPQNRLARRDYTNTHVVKDGESLTMIALAYGKSADEWRTIFDLNRYYIDRPPYVLLTGDILVIPDDWHRARVNDVTV